jgi:hypothetical protein
MMAVPACCWRFSRAQLSLSVFSPASTFARHDQRQQAQWVVQEPFHNTHVLIVPRDGRLIALILASKGVGDADDRVIHQLLDFAHRESFAPLAVT